MKKLAEAEKALVLKASADTDSVQVAGDAAGYYLLACIAEHQARVKEAIKLYYKALELNPTLWVAFEKLCKLDSQVKTEVVFRENNVVMGNINSIIAHEEYFNKTAQSLNAHMLLSKSRTMP
eukprot:TRINITY_DN10850_c0_g1_i15.p1 TRINITY_DN10850_c0_g1~~TRINITY_DN10850_c0_g1_i15.p1  ORF type:complete len:122 (-),score=28.00 TRINITY_DN10850_c0_g1_i15:147-512(-)